MQVSRSRRRTVRFSIALTLAVLLAGALVYTTFTAASPERFPGQLAVASTPGQTYQVGGRVLASSRDGSVLKMTLGHPGTGSGKPIQVTYNGTVPDPYRIGRDILIQVKRDPASTTEFVGQGNSLVTKCPSKFNGTPMNPEGGPATGSQATVADQASSAS